MKKKILISSIAVIALCLCLIAGSTFALFTTSTNVNIAVTAGELNVEANVVDDSMKTRSLGEQVFEDGNSFANGGSATFNDETSELIINGMTPGDAISFDIHVKNTGNVAVKYNVKCTPGDVPADKTNLKDALSITIFDEDGNEFVSTADYYSALGAPNAETTFTVVVEFVNNDDNNDFKGAVANLNFIVETVQENAVNSSGALITD